MTSSVISSLSCSSTAQQKYRLAYLQEKSNKAVEEQGEWEEWEEEQKEEFEEQGGGRSKGE